MSGTHHRLTAVLLVAAVALAAVPAFAQPAAPPAPPAAPAAPPAAPPGAPAYPPLPALPSVPPVPTLGPGQSLTLADAVARGLQQSFQTRLAAIQVALSRAQLAQAQAQILPTVGLTAGYTAASTAGGTTPLSGTITIPGAGISNQPFVASVPVAGPPPPWAFTLKLQYPLYTGNALQDQIAIAQANLRNAEAAFAAAANQVVLGARQAYYALEQVEGQVDAAARAVAASRENVRVAEDRVRVGTSPRFDLLQAQVQLAQSQLSLTQARANAVQAQRNLDAILGLPLTTVVAPVTPLGLPPAPPNEEALVAQALAQRPELVQARASIEAAQAAIDLAASGLRPNIAISGGPGITTSNPATNTPVVWSGTIELTLAIFDGGVTRAKIQQARQQLAQAQTNEAQLRQQIEQQVRAAYLGLESSGEQLRAQEAALASAREALRIASVRFEAGVGTQLDVVTALQNLASADFGVVQAEYNYNVALAQLDQAVGVRVTF